MKLLIHAGKVEPCEWEEPTTSNNVRDATDDQWIPLTKDK